MINYLCDKWWREVDMFKRIFNVQKILFLSFVTIHLWYLHNICVESIVLRNVYISIA